MTEILYCQSPALFLLAVVLLICFFLRRQAHRVRAALDLILWQRLRAGQGTWPEYRDFAARHGDWPGLAEADLYAGRDLMPTADVRAYAGAALSGLYGVAPSLMESTIFPGLIMPDPPRILL